MFQSQKLIDQTRIFEVELMKMFHGGTPPLPLSDAWDRLKSTCTYISSSSSDFVKDRPETSAGSSSFARNGSLVAPTSGSSSRPFAPYSQSHTEWESSKTFGGPTSFAPSTATRKMW